MKYRIILYLSIIFSLSLKAQSSSNEQLALDYFLSEIFDKDFDSSKAIYFSGKTEAESKIMSSCAKCFDSNQDFKEFCYANKSKIIESKILDFKKKVRVLKKPRARSLNLEVYGQVSHQNTHYVYIRLFKKNEYVSHYLIRIIDGKVIDYCFVGEII